MLLPLVLEKGKTDKLVVPSTELYLVFRWICWIPGTKKAYFLVYQLRLEWQLAAMAWHWTELCYVWMELGWSECLGIQTSLNGELWHCSGEPCMVGGTDCLSWTSSKPKILSLAWSNNLNWWTQLSTEREYKSMCWAYKEKNKLRRPANNKNINS